MSWQYVRAALAELRKTETYPFVIGFGVVLFLAGYVGKADQDDYRNSSNPRFSRWFVKSETSEQQTNKSEVVAQSAREGHA